MAYYDLYVYEFLNTLHIFINDTSLYSIHVSIARTSVAAAIMSNTSRRTRRRVVSSPMSTPRGSSQEARRRMAEEGVRRLHEWLQHQSVHDKKEEMERWVPRPTPPEKQAKAKSWLPVYSHGVIIRWEQAMAPEAAAEMPATWSKHLLTTTDRWESSIKLTRPASTSTTASAGSGGIDPDHCEADMQTARGASMAGSAGSADVAPGRARVRKPPAYAASGGVDPDVRRAKVGKTHASGSRAVDAAPDAPRAAPVKHQITLQEAEAIFFVRGVVWTMLLIIYIVAVLFFLV